MVEEVAAALFSSPIQSYKSTTRDLDNIPVYVFHDLFPQEDFVGLSTILARFRHIHSAFTDILV